MREASEGLAMTRERHADRVAAQFPQPLNERLQRLWIAAWQQADIGRDLREHSVSADHKPAASMIQAHMPRCMSAGNNELPFTAAHLEGLRHIEIRNGRLRLHLGIKAFQVGFNPVRPLLRHPMPDEIIR
ncbi:hypothetical protein D3C78_1540410 [compost metagenome]